MQYFLIFEFHLVCNCINSLRFNCKRRDQIISTRWARFNRLDEIMSKIVRIWISVHNSSPQIHPKLIGASLSRKSFLFFHIILVANQTSIVTWIKTEIYYPNHIERRINYQESWEINPINFNTFTLSKLTYLWEDSLSKHC